ncbi:MAG: molecular chaperone Tir [Chitinophagaceae bacterium]|nr:MAG: molecular chaperone Tir [Chitinophagaceae bacterium]
MAYRNRIYVGFDGDKDIHYYRLLTAWANNNRIDFDLNDAHDINTAWDSSSEETIKIRLRERFANSKAFILLVGESTKYLYKFVKWEIETAIRLNLPIIVVNLNKKRSKDIDRCPGTVRDVLAIHISYEMKIIAYAIDKWPESHFRHLQKRDTTSYNYPTEIYSKLGL